LAVVVPVGGGKPDMRIMKNEIFGGWFNIFTLDNVGFKYLFSGVDVAGNNYVNAPVFNDLHDASGLKINSVGLQANTNKIVRYSSSLNFYEEKDQGQFQIRPFSGSIIGYFGQNPDNRILCADSIAGATSFDGYNGKSSICKAISGSSCSNYFTWNDINTTQAGSLSGASNTCTNVATEMKINLEKLNSQNDGLVNFYGPFTKNLLSGQDEILKVNTTTGELKWLVNSNVQIDGVEVFTRTLAANINYDELRLHDDGTNCAILKDYNFTSRGVIANSLGSIFLSPTEVNSGNLKVVLCPKKKSGGYFNLAYFYGKYSYNSIPSQITFTKAPQIDGLTGKVYSNVCYPFLLDLKDSNGNSAYSQTAVTVNLISNNALNKFYDDLNTCDSDASPLTNVNLNNSKIIYFKATAAAATGYFVEAIDPVAVLTSSSKFYMDLETPPTLNYIKLVPQFYRALNLEVAKTEVCVPFYVAGFSSTNELLTFGTGINIDFSQAQITSPGDVQFFGTEANCIASSGAFSITQTMPNTYYEALMEVWVRVPTTPGTIMNILSSCSGATCLASDIAVVNPGSFNHLNFNPQNQGPYSGPSGACIKFNLGAYDNHKPNSYPTNFPQSGSFIYSTDYGPGGFYSDASCVSTASSLGVSGGSTNANFYFGWPTSSASSAAPFSINLDDNTNNHHLDFKLYVSP
jgi:hypothetical protein